MRKYATVILTSLVISFARFAESSSCCEGRERSITYLDMAAELISKAKSDIPCTRRKHVDCADWYKQGFNQSRVYTVWPKSRLTLNKSVDVYCDMITDGGGWTVIQRSKGKFGIDFHNDWNNYKNGFGHLTRQFWLGNDNIFALTNQKLYSIRFDLQDKDGNKAYAKYKMFWIDDEYQKYRLHIFDYSGNAGNGMQYHNRMKFTTKDNDNRISNCAVQYKGVWWHKSCFLVNLKGVYNDEKGISWRTWKTEPLDWTEMKIRPAHFIK